MLAAFELIISRIPDREQRENLKSEVDPMAKMIHALMQMKKTRVITTGNILLSLKHKLDQSPPKEKVLINPETPHTIDHKDRLVTHATAIDHHQDATTSTTASLSITTLFQTI